MIDMSERNLLGIGLYTIPEAARLIRVPSSKLRNWAKGYRFKVNDETRHSNPVINRELRELGGDPLLTFRDMVELYVVGHLRDYKIPMQRIRKAAENIARIYKTEHPFVIEKLKTDRRGIYSAGLAELTEMSSLQTVFSDFIDPFLENLDYRDLMPFLWHPAGRESVVVVDPDRSFGHPIVHGTRIPTDILFAAVRAGSTTEDVAHMYSIDEKAVDDAVRFEEWLDKKAA